MIVLSARAVRQPGILVGVRLVNAAAQRRHDPVKRRARRNRWVRRSRGDTAACACDNRRAAPFGEDDERASGVNSTRRFENHAEICPALTANVNQLQMPSRHGVCRLINFHWLAGSWADWDRVNHAPPP